MKKLFILFTFQSFLIAAQTNYAMDLNGLNASVNVGTSIGNTAIRSIEFWFKPNVTINASTSIGGWALIARNDDSEMHEYGVYIRGNEWSSHIGELVFTRRDNGANHEVFSNSNSWVAGTWHHVAGVIDPAGGMKLYINGILQNCTDSSAVAVQVDGNTTNIGVWGNSGIRYFDGRIEEMRIWNRAIAQNEIQTKMCQNLAPSNETGLVAYWKFNEGSGTQLTDATVNGYNGTVSNVGWITDTPCLHDDIAGFDDKAQLLLFPDPAGSMVNVTMMNEDGSVDFFICNSLGEKVATGMFYEGKNEVDLARLTNGIYIMCVKKANFLLSKKFIIQK